MNMILDVWPYLFWGSLSSAMAWHKNRNPLTWGLLGAYLWALTLIFLLLMPRLCGRCRRQLSWREARGRRCARCGLRQSRPFEGFP